MSDQGSLEDHGPEKLVTPPEKTPEEIAVEDCEFIIEQSIADVIAIQDGGSARKPSFRGVEYDEGYAQGRKDACRIILQAFGRNHVTSTEVRRG